MPHIWCPGCGIGTTVNCFARALVESKLPLDKVAVVSGIGCTGRVAGYMNLDSFHTTHGRAIPFATGLKLANPDLNVVVYSGDGDLIAIGGNHFIHAARRNVDITVICVNNFIYGMTGGQVAPTTPVGATATTVALRLLRAALQSALPGGILGRGLRGALDGFPRSPHCPLHGGGLHRRKGSRSSRFSSPCPTLYQRRNKMGDGLDTMRFYKQHSVIKNGASTRDVDINLQGEIIVGKFVDIERPTLQQSMDQQLRQTLRDRYAGGGGGLMAAHGNPHRGIRRTGRDPGGHGDRQSRRHPRRQVRDLDAELRPGGARQRLQRAVDRFDRAHPLPLPDPARHPGGDVAGGQRRASART